MRRTFDTTESARAFAPRSHPSLLAALLLLSLGADAALARGEDGRSPTHVQVVQFSDYAYREPEYAFEGYGGSKQVSNRTTFLAFNGSKVGAKVRVQGFYSSGDIAWEYDVKIPSMGNGQILRYVLDSESEWRPEVFVVSTEKESPVILTVHTIEEQKQHQQFHSEEGEKYASSNKRASQTHVPVKQIDCEHPSGYESVCEAPTRYTPWSVFLDAP